MPRYRVHYFYECEADGPREAQQKAYSQPKFMLIPNGVTLVDEDKCSRCGKYGPHSCEAGKARKEYDDGPVAAERR